MRKLLFVSLLFVGLFPKAARADVVCVRDTTAPDMYLGIRVQVSGLKTILWRGHKRTVTCTLVNTGRETVTIGKDATDKLLIQFDKSVYQEIHPDDLDAFRTAINQHKLTLQPGQVSATMEYKFRTAADAPSIRVVLPDIVTLGSDSLLGCADLLIDSIWVVKTNKKSIIIGYRINNIGYVPLSLNGSSNKSSDDVGFQFYYSSTPHVTKGSLPMGGFLANFESKKQQKLLQPNRFLIGKAVLPREQMTRFTPFIVVYADALQAVKECDETNNQASLLYK